MTGGEMVRQEEPATAGGHRTIKRILAGVLMALFAVESVVFWTAGRRLAGLQDRSRCDYVTQLRFDLMDVQQGLTRRDGAALVGDLGNLGQTLSVSQFNEPNLVSSAELVNSEVASIDSTDTRTLSDRLGAALRRPAIASAIVAITALPKGCVMPEGQGTGSGST